MSIYPKRVVFGENLIIHLRFNNCANHTDYIHYYLKIINPNGDVIFSFDDYKLLGIADDSFLYETYHSIPISKEFLPGKYQVDFHLMSHGIKIPSSTIETDYFYVDYISFFRRGGKIYLKNNSVESTPCIIYTSNATQNIILDGLEELKLRHSCNYIEYGNHNVLFLTDALKKYYIKNPDIKIVGDGLYHSITHEKYLLSTSELKDFKKSSLILLEDEFTYLDWIDKEFYIVYFEG